MKPAAVKSTQDFPEMSIFSHSLPQEMPLNLTPTALQRKIRHPAWIDAGPHSKLRDNLIMAAGTYDEDALCMEVLGGLFYFTDRLENNGLIVWADPWSCRCVGDG